MDLLEQHPIGQIVPAMSADERTSLRNDLVINGLRVPIVLYEGKILDGWHRYQLCIEEKLNVYFEEYAGNDPFGLVRSFNLSRRHLTLEQKREIAKHIFEREPGRSDNSIAKEIGLSHPTVAKIRQEVESNCKNFNKDEVGIEPSELGEPVNWQNANEAQQKVERTETSGRKARGRKPLSPEEKTVRAWARAAAKAEAKKESGLKPLTSVRDDEVETLAQQIGGNLKLLPEIVQIICGYDGVIHQKFTLGQRHEMVRKFAKALGVGQIPQFT